MSKSFASLHPSYCRSCGGWGGSSSPGCSVPYGSTSVPLPDDWDECPACVGQGLCPWCGATLQSSSREIPLNPLTNQPTVLPFDYCPSCGWTTETDPAGVIEPFDDYNPEDFYP